MKKRKLGRKLLSFLLTLAMLVGLMPGMGLTAYAASTYSLVPAYGQSGENYSITPSEDTLDAVKTALAAEMSLDTGTKEIWLYDDEYGGSYELDHLRNTMYYKVKSKPQEIVAGKTYVVGDSLYFHADKYYNNGFVQTGMDIFGSYTDYSKGQEVKRIESNNPWLASIGSQYLVLEEPSGHTYDSSVQPIGFKLADDSGDGSTAQNYIKFEAVYASPKTDQIVTAPVAVSNLTYTGSAQTLVSAATVTTGNTSGSITYSLDGTNYSADLPTGTNVGTYNVYYKVAGNDDYNEFVSASPVSVSIGKATPTVTAPNATNPIYTGAAQDLITAGTTTGGEIQYALGTKDAATEEYTTSIPTATDAGTYYVWYKAVGDDYHNDAGPEKVSVSIGKADATITAKDQTIKEGEFISEGTGNVVVSGLLTGHRLDAISLASGTGETAGKVIASDARIKDGNNQDVTSNYTVVYTPGILTVRAALSRTVTFKVVNGSWNDETTADKTVTLTGYEGDTLKLTADQIPAVGTKPNVAYKAGSWDVTPSTDTEITAATTYTYTYAAKEASVVTKAPEAKILTYNGSAQELVTAGEATGGEMQYALGIASEATQPYTTSIPTGTNAGTYYVWYRVVGDGFESSAGCVTVVINEEEKLKPGDIVVSEGDLVSEPVAETKYVTAEATVNGEKLSVTISENFVNAIAYTGKGIDAVAHLNMSFDKTPIVSRFKIVDGSSVKPEDLIKVSYVQKYNKRANAAKKSKPTVYARIKVSKDAKKALSREDYKSLKKLVKKLNRELKKNQFNYRINQRSVTACEIKVVAKHGADGKIIVKNGKISGVKKVSVSIDVKDPKTGEITKNTFKLSKKDYSISDPDPENGTVRLTGKRNFTGTVTVKVE